MIKNCPICGTKLLETTHGRKYCPNHGIIEEDKESEENGEEKTYIG